VPASRNVLSRLLPNLDRDDKFQLLNSVYRLSYFSFHQALLLLLFLWPLLVVAPIVQARATVSTTTGYVVTAVLLFLIGGTVSHFFEDYLLEKLKEKFKDSPHIRSANVRINLLLGVIAVFSGAILVTGIDNTAMTVLMSSSPLLESQLTTPDAGAVIKAFTATVVYSAYVFLFITGVLRALTVGYYRLRL
jgi:hypothetical protein